MVHVVPVGNDVWQLLGVREDSMLDCQRADHGTASPHSACYGAAGRVAPRAWQVFAAPALKRARVSVEKAKAFDKRPKMWIQWHSSLGTVRVQPDVCRVLLRQGDG